MLIENALLFMMLLHRLKNTSQSDLLSIANLFYYCWGSSIYRYKTTILCITQLELSIFSFLNLSGQVHICG